MTEASDNFWSESWSPAGLSWGVPHLKVCILELKDWNLREEERRERELFQRWGKDGSQALEWWEPRGKEFMRLKWMLSPRYQDVRQDNEFPVKSDTE